jgi:hypothetical protein
MLLSARSGQVSRVWDEKGTDPFSFSEWLIRSWFVTEVWYAAMVLIPPIRHTLLDLLHGRL